MAINHKPTCRGDIICPRCGRRMCLGCVTTDRPGENSHDIGHKGECVICSGMFKEEDITLWPADKGASIKLGLQKIKKPYLRFIRLEK